VTPWGVSQGEPTINLPHEYDNLDFDGKLGLPIVGLDRRKAGQIPFFEGTFIEMTAARALELEPGGTSAVAGGVTTVTPKKYGEFLVAADYKENVRLVFRMAGRLGRHLPRRVRLGTPDGGVDRRRERGQRLVQGALRSAAAGERVRPRHRALHHQARGDLQTVVTPDP
jgi:hypothetical protein